MTKPHVFLGVPLHDGRNDFGTTIGVLAATCKAMPVTVRGRKASMGPDDTQNELWAIALNLRAAGITHYAGLHSDVHPEPGWLDILLNVLDRENADVVSVVVPIKDEKGLTSTAVDNLLGEPRREPRLLTLHEVHALERQTFDAADAGYPDKTLCINTGCFVARLDRPWCESISFRTFTRIAKGPDGVFFVKKYPEDWDFGIQLAHLGAKTLATLEVRVTHGQDPRCTNAEPWGTVKTLEGLTVEVSA